jgi:hypothetical protein
MYIYQRFELRLSPMIWLPQGDPYLYLLLKQCRYVELQQHMYFDTSYPRSRRQHVQKVCLLQSGIHEKIIDTQKSFCRVYANN